MKAFLTIVVILFFLFAQSCGNNDDQYPGATPGDFATLQKLADSYRKQSDKLDASPMHLNPQARQKFLRLVFNEVGLSYHKTIIELGNTDTGAVGENHRDLAQLLRLPHYGMEETVKNEIYSREELDAFSKMEKW